jgi:UDP-N-acetylmuramyl pentapeptide phosphotransferase/UDP-N-acetylglucosamine-1-phosphate transferase
MLWISLVGFFICIITVYLVLRFSEKLGLSDVPNHRSSHQEPTPTGGGLGIFLSLCVSLMLYFAIGHWGKDNWALIGLVAGILIIGIVGFIDDRKSLRVSVRMASYLSAAIIVVVTIGPLRSIDFPFLGTIRFGALAVPISLIWIIAVTNIYNFIDGIDGLAAGEGVLAGGFLAYIGSLTGNTQVSAIGLFVAAASLGFLLFNFPPAKIFMGDVGSTTLGFTFAAVAIIGSQNKANPIPFLVMLLLLGSFLFDGTITLVRRALKRERLYEAHRDHFYQQAVQLGYTHRPVTLSEYGLETLLGGSAILYVLGHETVRLSILLIWPFVFTIIGIWLIEKKKHQNA